MPWFRKYTLLFALIASGLLASPARASDAVPSPRPGHYNEGLGSSLLLKADGRFDWHVGPKGNARVVGDWRVRDRMLTLHPDPPAGERFSPLAQDAPWSEAADLALRSTLIAEIEKARLRSCPYIASIHAAALNSALLANGRKIEPDRRRAAEAREQSSRALQDLRQRVDAYHASVEAGRVAEAEGLLVTMQQDIAAAFTAESERTFAGGDASETGFLRALDEIHARCAPPSQEAGPLRYAVLIENAPGTRFAPQVLVKFRTASAASQTTEAHARNRDDASPGAWAAWASDAPVVEIRLFWEGGPDEGLRVDPAPPGRVRRVVFNDLGGNRPVFDEPVQMRLVDDGFVMVGTEWRYDWRRAENDGD